MDGSGEDESVSVPVKSALLGRRARRERGSEREQAGPGCAEVALLALGTQEGLLLVYGKGGIDGFGVSEEHVKLNTQGVTINASVTLLLKRQGLI